MADKEVIEEEQVEDEVDQSANITINKTNNKLNKTLNQNEKKEQKEKEKEKKEKQKRVAERMSKRPMIQIQESTFFMACYDPFLDELYYLDIISEMVIRKECDILESEVNDDLEKRKEVYSKCWTDIQRLSQFGGKDFVSDNAIKYFKRPLSSSLLHPESLGLNNFTSTYPIPATFSNYEINLNIMVHSTVLNDSNRFLAEKERVITRKVGFFYVVDTIIKDSLRVLLSRLRNLIDQEDDGAEELNQEIQDEENTNMNNQVSSKQHYKNILSYLSENIKSNKFRFVLKLKSFEEYMYGDNPICTYESMRTLVREFEPVCLILMMYKKEVVVPSITHFPPLILVPEKLETDFYDLSLRFFSNFPENCIVYKLLPDPNLQEYYFKAKPMPRRKYLMKNTQSGESDFPFSFSIKSLTNLFAIKSHINSKSYNEREVDFPYFTNIDSKETIKNKKNIAQRLGEKMRRLCQTKTPEDEHNHDKKDEEDHHKKQIKDMLSKYPKNLKVLNDLNYLKIKQNKEKNENALSKFYSSLKSSSPPKDKLNRLLSVGQSSQIYDIRKITVSDENNTESAISYIEEKNYEEKNIYKNSTFSRDDKKSLNLENDNKPIDSMPIFEETLLLKDYLYFQNITPVYLKVESLLYYGSYELYKATSRFMIINNTINIEEKIIIQQLLLSHLPKETRLCFNIYVYDKLKSKYFILGCCSTSIFDENGLLRQGLVEMAIWPLFKIDPRIVCTDNYLGKHNFQDEVIKEKMKKMDKSMFTMLYVEFPKFSYPFQYTLKTPYSYIEFLKLKHPTYENKVNSTVEIQNLYASSMDHLEVIINSLKNKDQYFIELEKKSKGSDKSKQSNYPPSKNSDDRDEEKKLINQTNIWEVLEYALPRVKSLIEKDPLTKLEPSERDIVIYCRDYICTIPSALEIFLRCINWLDPLQVNLARNYLKKWKKIDPEDAISLLDARYPDTCVREYAISVLREMTDDLMNLYMLQMCQSLVFELYLVNPLSDFLIEKSIINPNQVGVSFFWNALVSMNSPLFKERLSIYLTQIFFLRGPSFLIQMKKSYEIFKGLKEICLLSKEKYQKTEKDKKNETKKFVQSRLEGMTLNGEKVENFYFPIHNSYFGKTFDLDKCFVFGSKMVPIKISAISSDDSNFDVIFKSGDDLRQDVLTLQILRVMDKMWLDNDLDLKIVAYRVLPTGIKDGFIQYVKGSVIDALQMEQGFAGALDRELLLKYLRKVGQGNSTGSKFDLTKQHENFVKSLAGFCVATCVMGIGDRHLGNVMLKDNGIFFHIDYGHFLGNFKSKFGIKRERAPFLLTPEMAHVYTKTGREEQFKVCCVKAYNILRKNANRLMNLFIIMSSAGLPELNGIKDVEYLKDMLHLEKNNDEDAGNYFIGLINQSKNEKFRLFDNLIHNFKHG